MGRGEEGGLYSKILARGTEEINKIPSRGYRGGGKGPEAGGRTATINSHVVQTLHCKKLCTFSLRFNDTRTHR